MIIKVNVLYIILVNRKIDDYILQEDEVSEVKYVSIEEIELDRRNKDIKYTFSNWSNEDFDREMTLLKNKRKEVLKIL